MCDNTNKEDVYEGSKIFLDICQLEYQNQLGRIEKLQNRASVLITIIIALVTFITSYFNLKGLLKCEIINSYDVIKIFSALFLLAIGIVLIAITVVKLYGIIKPRDYRTVSLKSLFHKQVYFKPSNVAICCIFSELIECNNYNIEILNKEFEKFHKIYYYLFGGIIIIMLACLLSNLLF